MTITTEEAELLARISDFNGPTRRGAIIRSLAAERDALRAENARLREAFQKYFGQSEATNIRALKGEGDD
jgi:hypothetical protein